MKAFVLLASVVCVVACSDITPPELVNAPPFIDSLPATATVGNATLRIEGFAWRDFMPGQTDDRMMAVVRVLVGSGQTLPSGVTVTQAWFVHGTEAWNVVPQPEFPGTATWMEVVARGGPRWPTGDTVFVAAEFEVAGVGKYRLKGPKHRIVRTE